MARNHEGRIVEGVQEALASLNNDLLFELEEATEEHRQYLILQVMVPEIRAEAIVRRARLARRRHRRQDHAA